MALTKRFCDSIATPGRFYDARRTGLYLLVKKTGAKSWGQRLVIAGKRRDLGLGSLRFVSLAEAREAAYENASAARRGGDPLADKRKAAAPTFQEAAERVIDLHGPTWRNPRAAATWRASLRDHAGPLMGMRVDAIETGDVLAVLSPVWNTKRRAAEDLKGRISMILRWAVAEGHRIDNPLPAVSAALPRNGRTVKHHRALGHQEVADAVKRIRAVDTFPTIRLAVEFLILTAVRSGEVRSARWTEIDLSARLWVIPASRTKTARPHRVPLGPRALAILEEAQNYRNASGLVFPAARSDKAIHSSLFNRTLKAAGLADRASAHGFRSTFRDWASETGRPRDLAEAALAHVAGTKTVQAYARSDLFERRRELMIAWEDYVIGVKGNVIPIRA